MTGTCDSCKRNDVYVQRDRRIPRWFGGDYDERNCHPLCHECHKRKSELERRITAGDSRPEAHEEWFNLAYPEPTPLDALEYNAEWRKDYEAIERMASFKRAVADDDVEAVHFELDMLRAEAAA